MPESAISDCHSEQGFQICHLNWVWLAQNGTNPMANLTLIGCRIQHTWFLQGTLSSSMRSVSKCVRANFSFFFVQPPGPTGKGAGLFSVMTRIQSDTRSKIKDKNLADLMWRLLESNYISNYDPILDVNYGQIISKGSLLIYVLKS